MTVPSYSAIAAGYRELWDSMDIDDERLGSVAAMARKVLAGKPVYQKVESATGVPWWFIGALHARESSCDFTTHLHNGDPLERPTVQVPAGRPKGPGPFTWEASAIDALKMKGLHKTPAWPIERVCFEAERFNGWGYRKNGMPMSPYLWAGTSHYTRGKYVADHQYSARAVDKQSGCIAVLKKLTELDPSFVLAPTRPPKPIIETVRRSYSLPALINGFLVMVAGVFTNFLQWSSDWAGWLFGLIPNVSTELQTTMLNSEKVSGALNIPWPKISAAVAASCILLAFVRELNRKRASS